MAMDYQVQGFKASAVAAGLKKDGALDLALIYAERECTAAGVFTTNQVKAAPVVVSSEHIRLGKARAIIANAGNANACNGTRGMNDARNTASLVAQVLDLDSREVLVASTGVIGKPLDMHLLSNAIPRLEKGLKPEGLRSAAEAIMTTDSFAKMSRFDGDVEGRPYRIVGIAKGAGMIMPHMATMLGFILTDVLIDAPSFQKALACASDMTFNRVTVDGDTSTNDTVLALANGMAGNSPLVSEGYEQFCAGLVEVMDELARMIAKDGEGATKFVTLEVKGAVSARDALKAAKAVANSPLVKTAFYGQDPNWGRVMAALGRSGISFDETRTNIWIDDVQIVSGGLGCGGGPEAAAAQRMSADAFKVTIDMNMGGCSERIYTCDLSHDYVSINAHYRT